MGSPYKELSGTIVTRLGGQRSGGAAPPRGCGEQVIKQLKGMALFRERCDEKDDKYDKMTKKGRSESDRRFERV